MYNQYSCEHTLYTCQGSRGLYRDSNLLPPEYKKKHRVRFPLLVRWRSACDQRTYSLCVFKCRTLNVISRVETPPETVTIRTLRDCGYPRISAPIFSRRINTIQTRTADTTVNMRNFIEFEHSAGTEVSSTVTCTDPEPKFGCKISPILTS